MLNLIVLCRYKSWNTAYEIKVAEKLNAKVEDSSSSNDEEMGGVKIRKFVPNSGVPMQVETPVRKDTVRRVTPVNNKKTRKQEKKYEKV